MKTKHLSIWGLIMINLAVLGGIRNWAPMAESGLSAIFFLILAVVVFFIPLSLVSAELATAWPEAGGVYVWVREAFGHRSGFLAMWLLFVQNVFWYPTILSFIVSSLTFALGSSFLHDPLYNLLAILALFWLTTFVNLKGIKTSAWMSSLGAIFGTFIAGCAILFFGMEWLFHKKPTEIIFSLEKMIPRMSQSTEWALFVGVIVSLLGVEMSAIHASEVKNPEKNYPKAIFYSSLVVILFSFGGVLSILMVIPQKELLLSAGCLQAFSFFLKAHGWEILMPLVAICVALGALGSMSTWIVGPSSGLLAAAKPSDLPPFLLQKNEKGVPRNLLLFQAGLVSLLSLLFVYMPTLNSAYWILLVLTTQLYLMMYLFLFAAAIKLKYKRPATSRPFKVPGGKLGMWCFAGGGFVSSLLAWIVCFFPPATIAEDKKILYIGALLVLILFFVTFPFFVKRHE